MPEDSDGDSSSDDGGDWQAAADPPETAQSGIPHSLPRPQLLGHLPRRLRPVTYRHQLAQVLAGDKDQVALGDLAPP